jgi:hypothetical protein
MATRLFRVKISGHGFVRSFEGDERMYGFFTNCFVNAGDARAASEQALGRVRSRPGLADLHVQRERAPYVVVTGVVEWNEAVPGAEQQGLVWYEEEPPNN